MYEDFAQRAQTVQIVAVKNGEHGARFGSKENVLRRIAVGHNSS
jgi:hypothetical protein